MTIDLTEMPSNLIEWLEWIEEDFDATDACVEHFEELYSMAVDGTPILLTMLQTFVQTCIGG